MKWSIIQLQKFRDKELVLDETIDMTEIIETDRTIRHVSPIRVTGDVYIGTNRFTFHLNIEGHLILPCSRTLVDVHFPINISTTETFVNIPIDERSEYDDEDVNYVEGNTIDLRPLIRELIIVEIPMQVYGENENDENAAPQSGEGWEVITEEQQSEKIDPRLADLAKLFEKDDE